MTSERELEIVRIGKQLEKLAKSDTPVRAVLPIGGSALRVAPSIRTMDCLFRLVEFVLFVVRECVCLFKVYLNVFFRNNERALTCLGSPGSNMSSI